MCLLEKANPRYRQPLLTNLAAELSSAAQKIVAISFQLNSSSPRYEHEVPCQISDRRYRPGYFPHRAPG
jgi:hypothetical protein